MASSPSPPILELVGVGKRFGDTRPAPDGIDLEVCPGELASVVGPPDCGKSTLLRTAAGLAGPSTGMLLLSSRVVVLSERPGQLLRTVPVPFASPKPWRLRLAGAFARLAAEVSDRSRADRW
jgi:ABC-type nitrate/sulfonate/bicarbonate transport system ATPase subunit